MSKTQERKILKEMLRKLKAKALNSKTRLEDSTTNVYLKIADVWKEMTQVIDEEQIKIDVSRRLGFVIRELHLLVEMLHTCSATALEDFNLYIDALERYSSELDKTLTDIFEQAKKMAEEQRRKQEELMKKEPSYRA